MMHIDGANGAENGSFRSVAQLVEQRSPKPQVGGSSPFWPAIFLNDRLKSSDGDCQVADLC